MNEFRCGCVVFLLDESAAMGSPVSGGTKSKAESVATAINSLLNRLAAGREVELALVGYHGDSSGELDIASRWGGPLSGLTFVSSGELAGSSVEVQTRTRRVPEAGGGMREEEFDFPVWYQPQSGEKAPQVAAFEFCQQLLAERNEQQGDEGVPVLIHIYGGASGDGNPHAVVSRILELESTQGPPLVMQIHLSSSGAVPATLFPSNRAYLPLGPIRDLFERSSALPQPLWDALSELGVPVNEDARGMIYNGTMVELGRLLSVMENHLQGIELTGVSAPLDAGPPAIAVQPPAVTPSSGPGPPPLADTEPISLAGEEDPAEDYAVVPVEDAPPTADSPGGAPALIALLLDRSVSDPYGGDLNNVCARLTEQANDLLATIAEQGGAAVETMVLSYGADAGGEPQIRPLLEGALAGRAAVPGDELSQGALRVEEFEEEVSDGVGGLISVPRQRRVYVEAEPAAAAGAQDAFAQLAEMVTAWCDGHPQSSAPPVVIHLTRGVFDETDIEAAPAQLQAASSPSGEVLLYHLIASETPQAAVFYPAGEDEIEDDQFRALWRLSSPLLGREELADTDLMVKAESRGFVLNGPFDHLLSGVVRSEG